MASTDAKPVPQKNVAYRVTFPILDADGDLVTGATGLDSEVSKDGGTFADCTSEATEIATNSGVYYLDLTSTEMNADTVAIIVKTSSSGGKTTTLVMYPEEAGDIRVNVTAFGGTAGTFTSGIPEVKVASIATDAITAAAIAADAIGASELATDAVTEIQNGLSTLTAAGIRTAVGLASANLDTQLTAIDDYIDTEVAAIKAKTDQLTFGTANRVDAQVFGIQAGAVTAAAIATDAIDADALAADALAEIKTQVVAALSTDTYAEPGQGAPAATASLKDKIGYLYKAWRNKVTQTNTEYAVFADDGTTKDHKATVSDDATTFTRGEVGTGA